MVLNLMPMLVGIALLALCLLLMRGEYIRSFELTDQLRGSFHKGKKFRPELIHPSFANRQPGRPTLVMLVSHNCKFCWEGLAEVSRSIPPNALNLCIAYFADEGYPEWLAQVRYPNAIIAPVGRQAFERLYVKLVPRWLLLSPSDHVAGDHSGYIPEFTMRSLAAEVQPFVSW